MLVDMITETTRRNVGGGYFKTKQLHRNFHTIIQSEFCLLDDIYKYTGQSGVADTMVSKHMDFPYCLLLLLSISVFLLFSFSVFTHF